MAIEVGDPVRAGDGHSLDWRVTSDQAGLRTETRYSLLRWDEIVRQRFPRSNLTRLRTVPALWWRLWRSGYVRAFRREARQFSRVIIGVHLIYVALVAISLAIAATFASALLPASLPGWLAALATPFLAYPILGALTRLTRGKPFYVAHLVDDTAFTHEHAAARDVEMRARLDAWAARIAAAEGDASEIVVIGHSSSSFLALEALDRILAHDPDFGRRGTPVSLVTIGSVIPWITLDPRADMIRGALQRVAEADAIRWLDLRAKWDWLSIHRNDPVAASGLTVTRPDRPVVRFVKIDTLIEPAIVARRRWNLFRMHFQLLMSSRDADAFDYVALVAGATPIHLVIDGSRRPLVSAATPDRLP